MKRFSRIAIAAAFTWLPATALLAQTTQDTGAGTAPAAPAPAASPAPSPAQAAPAESPAPVASPAPAASPPPAASPSPTATTTEKGTVRKKKTARRTTHQEIEHSVESGTVPSRYRSRVPKEYQKYIPFEK